MLQDITGKDIQVGDVVLFTEPGAGRNLPGLVFGEVVAVNKASVKVHYLDNNHKRVQREEMIEDRSVPPYHISSNGVHYYRYVGTGRYVDKDPDSVRFYKDRFYIVGKI